MRSRRQLHPPLPGFTLALPSDNAPAELQVQQKNEQEINKFFIDVDDAMVSPVITTGPRFTGVPDVSPSKSEAAISQGAGDGSQGGLKVPPKPHRTVTGVPSANGPPPLAAGAAAKFIHVNNTTLFVLMDGVSMFFEGKSTFTGAEDPLLLQQVKNKKTSKAAQQQAALRPTPPSSATCGHTSSSLDVDTVEEAIRGIECNEPGSSRAHAGWSGAEGSQRVSADGANKARTHREQQFAALFRNAAKPSSAPLFGHRLAKPAAVHAKAPARASRTLDGTATADAAKILHGSLNVAHEGEMKREPSTPPLASHQVTSPSSRKAPEELPVVNGRATGSAARHKPFSAEDVGHSNRSLDLDDVEVLNFIGAGSQGNVYCVMVDNKLYALKLMDVKEATEATNAVERQGRKRGLVKELSMIREQRSRLPSRYLMQMFNAVASLSEERQKLNILMELMSFSVEDAQKMAARIPLNELMKITQSTFRNHMSGDRRSEVEVHRLMKQQHGSCMHVLGRSSYNSCEDWEKAVERQTQIPEIVLSVMAADVLRGLQELHDDYGIVHCDLKPANVLLCFDKCSFKLADFGCGCVIDSSSQKVRRVGVDLGSKLYKAPERLGEVFGSNAASGGGVDVDSSSSDEMVEFTAKADVWSLGIMLMELSSGVHPCNSFKSDFWNYMNLLKLSKMIKPLSWSAAFCDFIVRCVCVNVHQRWSVAQLLKHPFILKYTNVPRNKLKSFMERLERDSATFQRRQQRDLLQQQITLSTAKQARDNYQKQSRTRWRQFTGFLNSTPELKDPEKFPQLR